MTPLMRDWSWTKPLLDTPLRSWLEGLPEQVERIWRERPHGELERWRAAIESLPAVTFDAIDLCSSAISAGELVDCDQETRDHIGKLLMELHPWRKGPYEICGLHIDTEWRSDWKWERIAHQIQPLQDRLVLDVGCGNGYHCWRMAGQGARQVIGIDPTQLFVMQFQALRHFIGDRFPVQVLPLGIEDLPANLQGFDTVFSMGVFYHRRSPFEHLAELKGALRRGGELVLETLVIEGGPGDVLVPEGRYAKMRNVWFIPSPSTLESWLRRAGFEEVRLIDVNQTSLQEQRATGWMRFESLADYLDPDDINQTLEGLPAPRRGTFLARA